MFGVWCLGFSIDGALCGVVVCSTGAGGAAPNEKPPAAGAAATRVWLFRM